MCRLPGHRRLKQLRKSDPAEIASWSVIVGAKIVAELMGFHRASESGNHARIGCGRNASLEPVNRDG
jgi:hypothetical protein